MTRLFLDHNATTPLKPQVRDAMIAAMEAGNPSSVHEEGRKAKALVEEARASLAKALDASANGIIFTSGGTEGINMALWGMVRREKDPVRRIFVSAIEHDATRGAAAAIGEAGLAEIEEIPVTGEGEVDAGWLQNRLARHDAATEGPFLVSIMLANNENGVVQKISAVAPGIFERGGYLFVDAVQVAGKIPVSFNHLQADLMAVSAHKIGGPKGAGALLTKPGIPLAPLLYGGGQEQRRRVGTENVTGIAGLGAAASAIDLEVMAQLAPLRDRIIDGLKASDIEGLRIWGEGAEARLPNTVCFAAPGFRSETQVMALDLEGVAVSAGAACSSGKVNASQVTTAMGASEEEALSTIRVSLGWNTPADAPEIFLEKWRTAYGRAMRGRAA